MSNLKSTSKIPAVQSILWFACIPQCLLLFINIRSWTLISGETGQSEISAAWLLLVAELTVLLASFVVLFLINREKISVTGRLFSLIALAAHASYMFLFLFTIDKVIPDTVQPWIVSEGNVGRWNITLFMPGAFISLYAFSKAIFSGVSVQKAGLLSIAITFGVPLIWYLFVSLMQPSFLGQFDIVVWILISTLLVVLFLAALIYIFDSLIHKQFVENVVEKHYLVAFILGLAGPIGGLYLNRGIPFPVDFQSTNVYVLAVLNGLVLLLVPGLTNYHALKYFLRCVCFPFTLYFFLVFLPFLPLSLLAIIVAGAGFLMLTPLALGFFQLRITLNDYNVLAGNIGRVKAIAITLAGLLVLPGYFVVEAVGDKNSLNKTLNYFYAHDFNSGELTESDIAKSTRALVQLRDRKNDIQLPYISGFYNAVVFGDMVLPNSKISETYKWLTNQDLPDYKSDMFSNRAGARNWAFRGNIVKPNTDVTIESIEETTVETNKSTLKLTLRNQSDSTHSLYVGELAFPEGVFISDLRLKIEGEWVDGRVFDKKTALWVFQKITEVRRDPAIVYYKTPNVIELRVYPFPAGGVREVEIDFSYHEGIDSTVSLDDREIDLNPDHDAQSIIAQDGRIILDASLSSYAFVREPYLHFILDFSDGSKLSTERYIHAIRSAAQELGVNQGKLVAANISSSKAKGDDMIDLSDEAALKRTIESIALPELGGFWLERALLSESTEAKNKNDKSVMRRSVFVVIQSESIVIDNKFRLFNWRSLNPDMQKFYTYNGKELNAYSFQSGELSVAENSVDQDIPVIAIKQGEKIDYFAANESSLLNVKASEKLEFYNPISKGFERLSPIEAETTGSYADWSRYAELWLNWKNLSLQPGLLEAERAALLKASRENNLLIPTTSLIVVERDAQWKILERKEKQSLSNHSALEFEEEQETSEPPWWLLLMFVLLYLYVNDRKKLKADFRQKT